MDRVPTKRILRILRGCRRRKLARPRMDAVPRPRESRGTRRVAILWEYQRIGRVSLGPNQAMSLANSLAISGIRTSAEARVTRAPAFELACRNCAPFGWLPVSRWKLAAIKLRSVCRLSGLPWDSNSTAISRRRFLFGEKRSVVKNSRKRKRKPDTRNDTQNNTCAGTFVGAESSGILCFVSLLLFIFSLKVPRGGVMPTHCLRSMLNRFSWPTCWDYTI